ncbi:hypothetical protein K438DRAFT_1752568 [Mycena galopus ATCC 62051]|nr:hypothetical protein K438DRAFT_1752568 [Mycena galopus ATCC 62051]
MFTRGHACIRRSASQNIASDSTTEKPAIPMRTTLDKLTKAEWPLRDLIVEHCQKRSEDRILVGGGHGTVIGEFTFWLAKVACARAYWLVSGVGVDFGGITRPRPAFRLASHFVGLASHFDQSGLALALDLRWKIHYYMFPAGPSKAQDAPGNRSFPSVTKWLAQAILSDAIKLGVGRLVTNSHGIHAIIRSIPSQLYSIHPLLASYGEILLLQTKWGPQAIWSDAIKRAGVWFAKIKYGKNWRTYSKHGKLNIGGRRDRPSHFPPTDPIPVVVKDVLKGNKNEEIKAEKPAKRAKLEPKKEQKRGGTKRKAHDEIDDENRQHGPELTRKRPRKVPARVRKTHPPRDRPLGALVRDTGGLDNQAEGSKKTWCEDVQKTYPIRLGAVVQSIDSDFR